MLAAKCPSDSLAVINRVFAPPGFFPADVKHVKISAGGSSFVYSIDFTADMKERELGFNVLQRKWMNLSLKDELDVIPFRPAPDSVIGQIVVELDFLKKASPPKARFDTDEMSKQFLSTFSNAMFMAREPFVFEFNSEKDKLKVQFSATVKKLVGVDLSALQGAAAKAGGGEMSEGLCARECGVIFDVAPESLVSLSGGARGQSSKRSPINPNWNFEDMGIGGLDQEFSTMFRRAFASRVMPLEIIEKLGIKHVRGMLLHGPPGTGKTLMARQIGKMLQGREPKIVNGPEILNKYVGESEANIRKLFEDAEAEYKARGENSSLHIIIFDEIDAICKVFVESHDG